MKKGFLLSIIFLICLSQACKVSDDEDKVVSVAPLFEIEMRQDLQNNGALNLIISSVELQDCENYEINSNWNKTITDLSLNLLEIIPPNDCVEGTEKAITTLKLGDLGNNRSYNIAISLQDAVENNGKMVINNEAFRLELEETDGLGVVRTELLKIPQKVIWGYFAQGSQNASGDLADMFIDELKTELRYVNLNEGYYGHFNIFSNNRIGLINPPEQQFVKSFIFTNDSQNNYLREFVTSFNEEHSNDGWKVKIFTWDGLTYE